MAHPPSCPWAFHINPTYPCQEPTGSPMACGLPDRLSDAARQWYADNGFHPTFFYEALWNVVGFGLLMFIGRRFKNWLRDGDIFLMYLIWYPRGPLLGRDVPARRLAHGRAGDRAMDRDRRFPRGRCGAGGESPAAGQG